MVEGRAAGLQQVGEHGFVGGGAEPAPAVDDVDGLALAQADRAGPGPVLDLQRVQGLDQAQGVGLGGFAAVAGATAALQLEVEAARTLRGFLQAEQRRAQGVVAGERAQPVGGLAAGAEETVEVVAAAEVEVGRMHQLQPPVADDVGGEPPGAQLAVAAQLAVVGGLQALDQFGFLQQRADLAGGRDPFDAAHLLGEAELAVAAVVGGEVRQHAAAQPRALADVERQVLQRRVALAVARAGARPAGSERIGLGFGVGFIVAPKLAALAPALAVEQIHPRRVGQVGDLLGVEVGGQAGVADEFAHRGIDVTGRKAFVDLLPELPQQPGVAERTVAVGHRQAVALDEVVETVAAVVGEQPARQLDGAQHLRPHVEPGAAEGGAQVAVVEACVVGDEEAAVETVEDLVGDVLEARCVGDHVVVDAGEALDGLGDARRGTHQRRPLAHAVLVHLDDADLGDGFALGWAAGGLDVDKGEAAGKAAEGGRQEGANRRMGSLFERARARGSPCPPCSAHAEAGVFDGLMDVGLGDEGAVLDGGRAGRERDLQPADAGQVLDGIGHQAQALLVAHAGDRERGGVHGQLRVRSAHLVRRHGRAQARAACRASQRVETTCDACTGGTDCGAASSLR